MCSSPKPFNESVAVMLSINSLCLLIYGLQLHYRLQSILMSFCRLSKQKKLNVVFHMFLYMKYNVMQSVLYSNIFYNGWCVFQKEMCVWFTFLLMCNVSNSVCFYFLWRPCGDALFLIPVRKSDENILWLIYFINRLELLHLIESWKNRSTAKLLNKISEDLEDL